MSGTRRTTLLIGAMLGLLLVAAVWSVLGLLESRALARAAMDDLASSRQAASAILALRGRPMLAAATDLGDQEIHQQVATAMQTAGLDRAALRGVYPQGPRKVGDSSYSQKPTTLTLANVPLPGLTMFLYHLSEGTGLSVRDLRLRPPRGDADVHRWDAELTVTYLIYTPASRGGRSGGE